MQVRARILSVEVETGEDGPGSSEEHLYTFVWRIFVDAERTTLEYDQRISVGFTTQRVKLYWPENALPEGSTISQAFETQQRWLKRISAASKVLHDFYAATPEGRVLLPRRPLSVAIPEDEEG